MNSSDRGSGAIVWLWTGTWGKFSRPRNHHGHLLSFQLSVTKFLTVSRVTTMISAGALQRYSHEPFADVSHATVLLRCLLHVLAKLFCAKFVPNSQGYAAHKSKRLEGKDEPTSARQLMGRQLCVIEIRDWFFDLSRRSQLNVSPY